MQTANSKESEENKKIPYMKYLIDYIPPEIQKMAEEELGETDEIKKQCLEELKKLIKEETEFNPCTEDKFLLRFLRCRKYDLERAFITLKNFYKFKARYSGTITDLTPSNIRNILDLYYGYGLEYRDANHRGVAVWFPSKYDIEEIDADEMIAAMLLMGELVMSYEATQITGYSSVVDLTDLSLKNMKFFGSPSLVYRLITSIQDIVPLRVNNIHFVRAPFYISGVFFVAKQFMKKKLTDRFHFHNDLESLHKFIPPEILPEELGGKQGPFSKNGKVFIQALYDREEEFKRMNKFGFTGNKLLEIQKGNEKTLFTEE